MARTRRNPVQDNLSPRKISPIVALGSDPSWSQNSPNQKIKAGWMSVMRRTTVIRSTVPARECLFSDGIVLVSGSIRAADIKRLHWTWTTFGLLSLNLALIWDKPGIKITFSTPLICLWLCFHHYSNKLKYRRPSSLMPCLWIQSILKRYRFSIYVVRYLNTLVLFLDCGSCLRCVPD